MANQKNINNTFFANLAFRPGPGQPSDNLTAAAAITNTLAVPPKVGAGHPIITTTIPADGGDAGALTGDGDEEMKREGEVEKEKSENGAAGEEEEQFEEMLARLDRELEEERVEQRDRERGLTRAREAVHRNTTAGPAPSRAERREREQRELAGGRAERRAWYAALSLAEKRERRDHRRHRKMIERYGAGSGACRR